jgi:uncharacterized protein YgiB involved in biofilm formation
VNEKTQQLTVVMVAILVLAVVLSAMGLQCQKQSSASFADCMSKGGKPSECTQAIKEIR